MAGLALAVNGSDVSELRALETRMAQGAQTVLTHGVKLATNF
jgi:hypothetical protein